MTIERRINKHSSKAISYSNIYLKKSVETEYEEDCVQQVFPAIFCLCW